MLMPYSFALTRMDHLLMELSASSELDRQQVGRPLLQLQMRVLPWIVRLLLRSRGLQWNCWVGEKWELGDYIFIVQY